MKIEIELTEDEIKEAFRAYCRDRLGISDNYEVSSVYIALGKISLIQKEQEDEQSN